ncbi:MAG: hypothetical protein U0936_04480 [Planctomycetaceae bacterium]
MAERQLWTVLVVVSPPLETTGDSNVSSRGCSGTLSTKSSQCLRLHRAPKPVTSERISWATDRRVALITMYPIPDPANAGLISDHGLRMVEATLSLPTSGTRST